MKKHLPQFDSVRIGHNILWNDELPTYKPEESLGYKQAPLSQSAFRQGSNTQSTIVSEVRGQALDLEDIWNSIQQKENSSCKKGQIKTQKLDIMNICDEPATLTAQEFDEVFGITSAQEANCKKTDQKTEEAEDLGQLWDEVEDINLETPEQKLQDNSTKKDQKDRQGRNQAEDACQEEMNKAQKQSEFYEIEEKDTESRGRTCLTLGKDYHIYDLSSFLTSCFEADIYSYFGFEQPKPNYYTLSDLTSNEVLMSCSLCHYEDLGANKDCRKNIVFENDYCLKIRLREEGDVIANIWQKTTANGILYNLRQHNYYEMKYQDSLALVEISDAYIGNNCYCNTTAFISQKHSSQQGPLKMRLSLKNGYLIAHMGVNGIRSAPYNCRLENSKDSFVFLLGLIEKDSERFLLRLGEGISPVVAFTIAIGRKRYIDSFKQ